MSDASFNYHNFYKYAASIQHFHRYVEVGVLTGASCVFLARQLLERGTPFELYAVDLWHRVNEETNYTEQQIGMEVWDEFMDRLRHEKLKDHVQIMVKESIQAAADFADGSLDFVFIDANHDYEYVRADILAWQPKIKIGGMLSGHDILEDSCGVKKAVTEIFGDDYSMMAGCWYKFIK